MVHVCSETHCRQWHGEHWQWRLSNAPEPQVAQEAISFTSMLTQHVSAWSWKHTSSLAQGTTAFIKIQVCSSSEHGSRHGAPGYHHPVQLKLDSPLQTATKASRACACCRRADFKEIRLLGTGNFSKVYLAQHRLDGVSYAVKRSIRPVCSDAIKRQWVQVQSTCTCRSALHALHNTCRHAVQCNFIMPLQSCS